MSTVTLAESAKLSQNMLVRGIIEAIVTVDKFYELLPFQEIEGNALSYNRENALGDVQYAGVGDTITAKNPATFTNITTGLTTIIGDAEVNGLIQATRSNINDQKSAQILSKAKNVGLTYRDGLINGDGTSNAITGLLSLVPAGQMADTGVNGRAFDFDVLDELIDLVTDKNGVVDYIQMPDRTMRTYFSQLRALGGAGIGEVVSLPSGTQVPAYRSVPIFRNQNIPVNQSKGTGSNQTTIIAGTIDDGSMTMGIAGLTAMGDAGIRVTEIGEHQSRDESITRIKMYCGLALFSELGIAAADGITD